jgi:hemolysin activation/secretion protein
LPQQDLTEGWVQVNVLEARFAGATVSDPTGQLANTKLPVAIVEHAQPKGDVVSLDALDKATMLLADVPGVQTSVSLRPGESVGETEAVVTVSEGKPIEASVGIDNAGSRATGETRETARLAVNNPLHIGDSVGLQVLHSEGLTYNRVNYSVPMGDAGWRVGANSSAMNYKLITPEFASLAARGPSKSTGIDLTVPLVRTREQTTSLQLAYDSKKFRNENVNSVMSDYSGSALTASLESVTQDAVLGAETALSAQLVKGNIDLSNSPNQSYDAATTQTEGDYTKLRLSASRKQAIDASNTLVASVQTQWANKNLDGSEKFYLGGAQGVRAYPTSEAGGSMGNLMSLEWQRHFEMNQNRWTLASFYDWGHVTVNKLNDPQTGAAVNKYSLSGYGLWIGTTIPGSKGLSTVRLTWSRRLGHNAAAVNGLDQDGSFVKNRFRFNVNHAF